MIIRSPTLVLLLFSLFLITEAKKFVDPEKNDYEWREFEEYRDWKKSKSSREKEMISSEHRAKKNKEISLEEDTRVETNFEKPKKKEYEKKAYEKSNDFDKREYKKTKDFQKKKNYEKKRDYEPIIDQDESNRNTGNDPNPPPINEAALMARYIVNQASES